MSFIARLQRVREILEQQGRLSTRALERELEVGGEELDELVEELVDVQRVARREGRILVWTGASATPPSDVSLARETRPAALANRAETRKVISILFADLMGSTALQERLDPESVNRVMDAYYQAVRGPVEGAGGTVVQLLGDGVLCAFGIPRIAEDDALRAVRAAVGIQRAFREFLDTQQWLSSPIGLRVAVNTGEVVVSDEHPAGIGDPLNVAARLQQEARDGEVLIGQATRRLVADAVMLEQAGVFALKGRSETVTAYRVVSLERPTGATTAAFVGRDEELARLSAVYETAVGAPAARLAVVLGSPGLGKSRLIDELGQRLGGQANVIAARCDAAGGATFAPVAEAVRTWLGAGQSDATQSLEAALPADVPERARIVNGIAALFAGSPASPEETFFVIRRLLTALAQNRPVILVIDDLHWGEPLLLDLVEHLIQWGSGVPLFVLIGARPELRDVRSGLVTPGGLVSEVVTLSGLDAYAAMRLAANVIGAADLPAAVAAKVLATSEGNPLFVGELVRMLVDEGALERQGERWIVGANLAALEMPPTIHALLASRIERLRPEERTVLEHASVVGRHFSRSAVAALLGRDGSELDARFEALRRTELIERDTGWFLGEPMLRFHHVLIRDAAYRRLLKGTRAELHAQLAGWIEGRVGEAAEHDETIGWHLEQAHQHLRELGPLDASGKALGERAARRLAAAGRRALARDDVAVAADLLGRAIGCLDPDDSTRADLALDWCEALLAAGDVGPATNAIEELGRFARTLPQGPPDTLRQAQGERTEGTKPGRGSAHAEPVEARGGVFQIPATSVDRLRAWHTCFTGQLTVMTAPQELEATAAAVARAAEDFTKLEDAAGEAKAHFVEAQALARLGRVGACEAALDKALAAARKAGDRRRANAVLAGAPLAALWGPSPVTRASGRCLDVVRVLRITQGAPAVEAVALSCQGVLEALRGRTDAARRMIASARRMVEDLGIAHRLHDTDVFAGRVDLLEGDAAAAEKKLRAAYEGLREVGFGIDAARAGALLARALLLRGEVAEAERLTHESERLAGNDLQAAIAWRGVRAEALARRGEHATAVELANAAVEIAAATDALLDHADARMALAAVLRAAGRTTEADAEAQRAIELWQTKGATLLVERAADGLIHRNESFDAGREAEALARFDELTGARPPAARRVRENAVTASIARFEESVVARDADVLAELLSERFELVHHPTATTYGRRGMLTTWRSLFGAEHLTFHHEMLATLGESLALHRHLVSAEGFAEQHLRPAGSIELEEVCLTEVDEDGRATRFELFAADHLREAIVRLYERHAELFPEGVERDRAAAIARTVAVLLEADLDRLEIAFASDCETTDRRIAGFGSGRGVEWLRRLLGSASEFADELTDHLDGLAAAEPDGLLLRWRLSGKVRASGGAFESPFLRLHVLGADGLVTHSEAFDADREEEALARLAELTAAEIPSLGPGVGQPGNVEGFGNAATRLNERFTRAWAARDWDTIETLHSPQIHLDDRRRLLQMEGAAATNLAYLRVLFDVPESAWMITPIATRGERLALSRYLFRGNIEEGGGPLAIDYLGVDEVDGENRFINVVLFDPGDLDGAYAELDRRFEAGEAAHGGAWTRIQHLYRAVYRHDRDECLAELAPTFSVDDHRPLGWGTTLADADLFFRAQMALIELAPDFRYRVDHFEIRGRGFLTQVAQVGTREGGAFESPFVYVGAVDEQGRSLRFDLYDVGQLAAARARFAEVAASAPSPLITSSGPLANALSLDTAPEGGAHSGRTGSVRPPIEGLANAATRFNERFLRAWAAGDWDAIMALHGPAHHMDDRRRLMQMQLPVDPSMAQLRVLFDVPGSRWVMTPIATRGERLALSRIVYEGDVGAGGGTLAIDYLAIDEVDGEGRSLAVVFFDPDDLDAAYAELDRRFETGEGAEHAAAAGWRRRFAPALDRRDWDAVAACYAPAFVGHDHRLAGWGTLHGPAGFLRALQAMVELAPDARARVDHVRATRRGALQAITWVGTRDGGAFESPFLLVDEFDAGGLVQRHDFFDPHRLDAALARFDEVSRDRSALRIPPNEATRAGERQWALARAGDWDGLRALCSPSLVFEDRRRGLRTAGGRDMFLASLRTSAAPGVELSRELLATAGDRLALEHRVWSRTEDVVLFEIESLTLTEIDAGGRIATVVIFDPGDRAAAHAELFERYAAAGGDGAPPETFDLMRAFNAHDLERMQALLPDDFYLDDHRRTGVGRLEGAEAFLASIGAMYELSRDLRVDPLYIVSIAEHGRVYVSRWSGTNSEGGEFDAVYVVLGVVRNGRPRGMEIFEIEDLDAALARFEELGGGAAAARPTG